MVIKVSKIDERKFLQINNETVEIAEFTLKSSADGSTELSVVIRGNATMVDMSVNLIEKTNISPLQQIKESFEVALRQPGKSPLSL